MFSPFSGAENHLWVLLPALKDAGQQVQLAILLQQMGPTIRAKITELQDQGIAVSCFPFHSPVDIHCLAAVSRYLGTRKHWIVHTHLESSDVYAKTAAWLAGCKRIVSTCHNNEPGHARIRWFYLLRLMDRLTRRHIAISETVRRHLIEVERVNPDKVTVIPYGLRFPSQIGNRAELRARLGLPVDKFVVGYVGRLVKQKNVDLLIEAMRRLPDAQCAIIGQGGLRSELQRRAAGLANVRFIGHVPQAADLIPCFDTLCLPSRWEGLGLVLLEAMQRGVPVIGSRAGAVPEVLGQGLYGVLFDPNDVSSLIDAIQQIRVCGPATAKKAADYVRNNFAIEKMVKRTMALYDEVANGA